MAEQEKVSRVARYVIAHPGLRMRDICVGTGLPRSTVKEILDLMVERSCVDAKVIGMRNPTRYFPISATHTVASKGEIM